MTAKRILVVDDEPNVVKSCARILELEGFEVQGTTSGAEAITLYKNKSFDLVLVDFKMPDIDGLQVLAEIRKYDPSASVVIVTAYGTKENVVEALRLGASEFLEKPLSTKTLISTARRILEQEDSKTVRGNLRTLSLPSIIQINCTEQNQARLRLRHQGQEAYIFFADGNVVHAVSDSQVGEEAVYELLTWEDGEFELEMDVPSPKQTINIGWSGLLLEGMRRIDERTAEESGPDEITEITEMEVQEMAVKKRSEQFAAVLDELLSSSSDIDGAALVGIDGLVLAANVPISDLDETLVGAASAAVSGLSRRSVEQMKRGEFVQTLIQGSKGYIIVTFVDKRNVFVGITHADANLGMVFHETRQVVEKLAAILK